MPRCPYVCLFQSTKYFYPYIIVTIDEIRICSCTLRSVLSPYYHPLASYLLGTATETSVFQHRRRPSANRSLPEVRKRSRIFLSREYLVPWLPVPETTCGFSRFESDIPPGGGPSGFARKQRVLPPSFSRILYSRGLLKAND